MKGEIDRDFYCSAGYLDNNGKRDNKCEFSTFISYRCADVIGKCKFAHRKHPTPEQYKEEYGEEVLDDFPVWYLPYSDEFNNTWTLCEYEEIKPAEKKVTIVVACTPFGKPDKDWRP